MEVRALTTTAGEGAAQVACVLLPWAGGNLRAPSLRALAAALERTPGVRAFGLELPGRGLLGGGAAAQEPLTSFAEAEHAAAAALQDFVRSPAAAGAAKLVIFGYSLGALLAWRALCALGADFQRRHVALFVAASAGAPSEPRGPSVSALPDDALLEHVGAKGGTPIEVLRNPDISALILPPLRSDYALLDSLPASGAPLQCRLLVLHGSDITPESAAAWASHVERPELFLGTQAFAGGHFFLAESADAVAAAILVA